ncbi:MAG: lipoate--protein ligase family protein [Chloroflexi bacterium]|nr:lipoate--protein ligase family protein [Chloroflexota bacterium]
MSTNAWRVIFHPPLDGPTNMAIDQAIMEAVSTNIIAPTLRFYAWQPACLSLGYGQFSREADMERITTHGWGLVRRATGGKAILHTDELTYSIAFPEDHPIVEGDILTSYRRLSAALLNGLHQLGVPAASMPLHETPTTTGPVCFEVPSNYEITFQDRKLIGSAQVRRSKAVLQHGSLPLWGDVARICDALVFENEDERESAKIRVRQRACTVEEALGYELDWDKAAYTMAEAFGTTFDIPLDATDLSQDEEDRANQLAQEIYADPAWNFRR